MEHSSTALAGLGRLIFFLPQLDVMLEFLVLFGFAPPLLRYDCLDGLIEDSVDVLILLRGAVRETPAAAHHTLGLFVGYLLLVNEVALVADQNHAGHALTVLLELADPIFDAFEGVPVAYVEYDEHGIAVPVVELQQRPVTLLAGCVPNLRLTVKVLPTNTPCCGARHPSCRSRHPASARKWENTGC